MALKGLVRVRLVGNMFSAQQNVNTFYISNPASGSVPDLTELTTLATDLDTWLGTQFKAMITAGGKYLNLQTAQVPDPAIPHDVYEEYVLTKNVAGTRSSTDTNVPSPVCAVISLKTPNAGRSYRGHIFAPDCINSADLAGNIFSAGGAYMTAINAFAAKLAAGCGPAVTWTGTKLPSYFLSIYSRTLQSRAQPSVSTCSAAFSDGKVHYLRSRARGTT